ncbi:MAG: TonB C-terminal domain-containing protein, partial [Deltaproteobacteria bacterium]|nr:TonB C-terminal domain-containing protein [Deltaproteobacteria bacterium]
RSPDDILSAALGDLKGKASDPDSPDPDGDGPGGSGGDGFGIVGSYMQSLVSRIKPNWEYAGRADRRNPTATVGISIGRDGTILEVELVQSSGDAAFDGSVLKAVRDTGRVEPPPTPDLMKVRVPFAYEAIRR